MATVEIDLEVPEGVQVCGYERIGEGHALEVDWPLPDTFTCERCRRSEPSRVEYRDKIQVIRDLDLWGQPSFFVYQPPFHRCGSCNHRQWLLPPFKRKHVTYTYRFEHWVLELLIGSSAEEVARRLRVSAEMVATIVQYQLAQEQRIDPERVVTDVGIDEISLKKRHKLYATILTDLTDPDQPRILAVAAGKDRKAAEKCLNCLSEAQRKQVRTHRSDMSPAFLAACKAKLPNSQSVIDRFHVAKKLGEMVDRVRKKKTRAYKKKLTAKQRKTFRSCLWSFRRRPEDLSDREREELQKLFACIPELEFVHGIRWHITDIFDTADTPEDAAACLQEYRDMLDENDPELLEFFATYEAHREGILAYFEERKSSGVVEGLNNKARVITKRCYGVKKAKTLWQHLCLDINIAAQVLRRTVQQMKSLTQRIRVQFLGYYT